MTSAKEESPNYEEQLHQLGEELYKHSREIVIKNKTLSLLSKLYEISILTLEPKDLSEKISQIIQEDLNFDLVAILLYDQSDDSLDTLTVSGSERLSKSCPDLVRIEGKKIASSSSFNFLSKIIKDQTMATTATLGDIWQEISNQEYIHCFVAYPLIVEKKVMGIFLIGINRTYEELFDYEKESLKDFVNVIAVAIDKALLYQAKVSLAQNLQGVNRIMSHDIKNVLGKNKDLFLESLKGTFGPLDASLKPIYEMAYSDTTKLLSSIMTILQSGQEISLNTVEFDVKEILTEVVERKRPDAEKKNLVLEMKSEEGDYKIQGDKNLLTVQVFENLIDNAIHYTLQGKIEITLSKKQNVGNTGEKNKEVICISIKDTGIGITEEDKKKLFTEGGHGKDSLKTNVHSTGYGLYIAKKIVDAHHGKIWAESEGTGKGSTFTVELYCY